MSCLECGFCQADLPALENIAVDTRSRGNYRIATMLDQALERCGVLRENLHANDREYLKNISRMAKEQSSSDVCTNILRDARRIVEISKGRQSSEPTRRGMGFGNMLEAARRGTFEGESQPETRDRDSVSLIQSGFQRRGMGFGAMLDAARPSRAIGKSEPEIRGRYGFRAMLDGASRGTDMLESETLDERPRVRRYIGFANMLEGASKGTE